MPIALTSVQQTSVPRAGGDGERVPLRLNRRGEIVTMPQIVSLVLEGKVMTANVGTISAPVTFFGASQTALILEDAEIALRNPTGSSKVIMPVYIAVVFEAAPAATINEVVFWASNANIGAGTSTAISANSLTTVDGYFNNNTAFQASSACTINTLYSAAGATTATSVNEFYRSGYPSSNQDVTKAPRTVYEWSAVGASNIPIVGAPGTLGISLGCGTAAGNTGFIVYTWAEFESSQIQ